MQRQELKEMLPAGVLTVAIRADFWQPKKNQESVMDQILASACCPGQRAVKQACMCVEMITVAKPVIFDTGCVNM